LGNLQKLELVNFHNSTQYGWPTWIQTMNNASQRHYVTIIPSAKPSKNYWFCDAGAMQNASHVGDSSKQEKISDQKW
jgi:hypothetical protein